LRSIFRARAIPRLDHVQHFSQLDFIMARRVCQIAARRDVQEHVQRALQTFSSEMHWIVVEHRAHVIEVRRRQLGL
jgi:hypothetical protein